ncbi:FtsX-like permease family protein [Kitasatospora sp. NPDC056184]|uniref:FtsX-like permease family protein n=1 Tax=Kitasatospora sp. NPDC056184 TaxID=3345738 RepID=UPI0035DE9ACF
MRSRHLALQLLRIGATSGRSSRFGSLRFTALLCAVAALTLATGSLVCAWSAYEGRGLRSEARNPQMAAAHPAEQPIALWAAGFDVVQGHQYSVVSVVPLHPDAPLPPGLPRWPGPGEAILSPALVSAGADEGITTRLGRDTGRIGDSGLSAPTEYLAYVRPPDKLVDRNRMIPITGYGASGTFFGDDLSIEPLSQFLFAITVLMVFPAGVLLFVAARMGGEDRDRRTVLLGALGATRSARFLVNLGECARPVLIGAVAGAGLIALWTASEAAIPFVGTPLPAADIMADFELIAACAMASAAAAVICVTALHRAGRRRGASAGALSAPRRTQRWWSLGLAAGVLLATRGPDLFAAHNPFLYIVVYLAGVVLTLATLPSALAALTSAAGRALTRAARRSGGTGALVAGRWLTARPGVTARLTAGTVVAIGLLGQVQLHTSRISEPVAVAQATAARIGTSVLTVTAPSDETHVTAFLQALPADIRTFRLTQSHEGTAVRAVLQGPCDQIENVFHRPCSGSVLGTTDPDPRIRELVAWYGLGSAMELRQGPVEKVSTDAAAAPTSPGSSVLVIVPSGGSADVSALTRTARQHLSLSPAVQPPGGEWLSAATSRGSRLPWVTFFGCCALVFTGLAIGLNSVAEFSRFSRSIAPVGILTGRNRLFLSVAAWTLLAPLVLAAVVGMLVHLWLATPLTSPLIGAQVSWSAMGLLFALTVALALVTWTGGSWTARRMAARWRPGME